MLLAVWHSAARACQLLVGFRPCGGRGPDVPSTALVGRPEPKTKPANRAMNKALPPPAWTWAHADSGVLV